MKKYTLFASYAAEFALCGLIGWLYEVAVMYVMWGKFIDRGYLHLPVLPIYGVFGMLLIPVFRRRKNAAFVFVTTAAVCTAGELVSSYIIEAVLGHQLWTYEMWRFNFDGRIALYSSLIFGGLGVMLTRIVHPLMRFLYERSAPLLTCAAGTLCAAAITADFCVTAVNG